MKARGVFEFRILNDIVEVWLPPVDHPEGELVLSIHKDYLPALIATLRMAQTI
jgi:hypothetical protein